MMREISIARHTWELLKPLESNADTVNVERHLPTQFQLVPPKTQTVVGAYDGCALGLARQSSHEPKYSFPDYDRPIFLPSKLLDQSRHNSHAAISPHSPSFTPRPDTTHIDPSQTNDITSIDEVLCVDAQRMFNTRRDSNGVVELPSSGESPYSGLSPLSPDFGITRTENLSRIEKATSIISIEPIPIRTSRTVPLAAPPKKERTGWRSMLTGPMLTGPRKSSIGASGDTSSVSSTIRESQTIDEISLWSLTNAVKSSAKGKPAKKINVFLSQNSTDALFWTPPSIHIWDVGSSPPSFRRAISTESTCVLAAVTKLHLAYIIKTQDHKLTVRHLAKSYRLS
jgi:hypothetical protein